MHNPILFPRNRKLKRKIKAFTLIELLIMIAIIAILAAILFPVFGRARENARRSACQSNLKQIGLALMQYSQDYDEQGPMAYTTETTTYSDWTALITPYSGISKAGFSVGKSSIFRCPNDPDRTGRGNARSYALAGATEGVLKYQSSTPATYEGFGGLGFAGALKVAPNGTKIYSTGRHFSGISSPADTLMVVEVPGNAWMDSNRDVVCYRPFQPAALTNCPTACSSTDGSVGQNHAIEMFGIVLPVGATPYHSSGFNYLFTDGHVKWLRPEKTIGAAATGNSFKYCDATPSTNCNMQGMWTRAEND